MAEATLPLPEITPYTEFRFWWTWSANGWQREDLTDRAEGDTPSEQEVKEDWEKFVKGRPEYAASPVFINARDYSQVSGDLTADYLRIFLGAALIRVRKSRKGNPDEAIDQIVNRTFRWLSGTDFFTAPASTRFHHAYPMGLVQHSLQVTQRMAHLYNMDEFCKVLPESAFLVALVHDWCKIQLYEPYTRNVKDDATGVWHKEPAYRRAEHPYIPLGHGDASAFLCQRHFRLTLEEVCAIKWHMGKWATPDYDDNDMRTAEENYPIVHMLQFADLLSTTNYK